VTHHGGATERLLLRVLRDSLIGPLALLLLLLWETLRWLLRGWLLLRGEGWCPLGLTHLYGVEEARHSLGERVTLLRTHIGGVYVVEYRGRLDGWVVAMRVCVSQRGLDTAAASRSLQLHGGKGRRYHFLTQGHQFLVEAQQHLLHANKAAQKSSQDLLLFFLIGG